MSVGVSSVGVGGGDAMVEGVGRSHSKHSGVSLPLAIVDSGMSVGVSGVGVGGGSVAGIHSWGDGSVGDHTGGTALSGSVGEVSAMGNLGNSPGLSLGLPLAVVDTAVSGVSSVSSVSSVGEAVSVDGMDGRGVSSDNSLRDCGGHLGHAGVQASEPGDLEAAVVGGGGDDAAVGLAGEHLADGVGIGLSGGSSHKGNNDESSHGAWCMMTTAPM